MAEQTIKCFLLFLFMFWGQRSLYFLLTTYISVLFFPLLYVFFQICPQSLGEWEKRTAAEHHEWGLQLHRRLGPSRKPQQPCRTSEWLTWRWDYPACQHREGNNEKSKGSYFRALRSLRGVQKDVFSSDAYCLLYCVCSPLDLQKKSTTLGRDPTPSEGIPVHQ